MSRQIDYRRMLADSVEELADQVDTGQETDHIMMKFYAVKETHMEVMKSMRPIDILFHLVNSASHYSKDQSHPFL